MSLLLLSDAPAMERERELRGQSRQAPATPPNSLHYTYAHAVQCYTERGGRERPDKKLHTVHT